ncbi:MAG: EF-P lysine aminoacylase EpmA [Thermodesulfobacteriota bacterium]|nr:EF-P lysine aminoacylase EpmA [Thermodesulfobacteriota bacterium]
MLDISGLKQRAKLIQAIRSFFVLHSYLEVDTPVRLPCLLPEAHIEPETSETWYLQTSPEICMKRLLAAGIPKIFQICKCFRRHERGNRHLPELTMLEWYRLDNDYHDLMVECEKLFLFLANELNMAPAGCNLDSPWQRLTVAEAFALYAEIPLSQALAGDFFDEILVRDIEPNLGQKRPTFLYDYPAELASLSRLKSTDPAVSERFELYINGLELANGFSELTDPLEQRTRFKKELRLARSLGRATQAMPELFLRDLGRIDKAAGIALGIDRLVMTFFGAKRIDEVVAFVPEEL